MNDFIGFANNFNNLFSDSMEYFSSVKTNTSNGVSTVFTSKGESACAFYEGRAIDEYVNSKLKAQVDAIAIHNPNKLSFAIQDQDKCKLVNNNRDFTVIHADNVGLQNGAIIVMLKKRTEMSVKETFIRYNVEKNIKNGINGGLIKVASRAVSQAKALMVPDTGLLRNSVMYKSFINEGGFNDGGGKQADNIQKIDKSVSTDEVFIGSNVNYALYEEFGTRNRGAKPYLRPAIAIEVLGQNGKSAMASALNNSINQSIPIKFKKEKTRK